MASSLQSSPVPKVTRSLAGTAQYGPVRMSDRLGRPIAGIPCPNQMNPMTVPTRMPRVAKNSRRRSSYRCSINDIVPSSDLSDFLRRRLGSLMPGTRNATVLAPVCRVETDGPFTARSDITWPGPGHSCSSRRPGRHPALPSASAAGAFFLSATSTAPKINFATNPKTARSNIIWMLTRIRATSVLAVMSPNPTVAKTVMVK